MKKTGKQVACMCLAALMACAAFTSCGKDAPSVTNEASSGKVVINLEGTVVAVNGNKLTLDSGKVVVISKDTVFAGDPDTGNQVSDQIAVGHFIQGFTSEDPLADRVTATRIWTNTAPQRSSGKIAVNFEGTVTAVEGNR